MKVEGPEPPHGLQVCVPKTRAGSRGMLNSQCGASGARPLRGLALLPVLEGDPACLGPALGVLGDLMLQEGLVNSLTALPLGSAGSTVYFILFPPSPRRARRLSSSLGAGINDFDAN